MRLAAQRALVDAAVDAGVKLFFADEFVADITAPQYVAMPASYVGDKIAVRAYLEERAGRGEIGWVALNGGPFFDMCEFSACLLSFLFECLLIGWLLQGFEVGRQGLI